MSEAVDRASLIYNTEYLIDKTKEPAGPDSKKSWWMIGITIGFVMNFLVFLFFYIYHRRNHLKHLYKER